MHAIYVNIDDLVLRGIPQALLGPVNISGTALRQLFELGLSLATQIEQSETASSDDALRRTAKDCERQQDLTILEEAAAAAAYVWEEATVNVDASSQQIGDALDLATERFAEFQRAKSSYRSWVAAGMPTELDDGDSKDETAKDKAKSDYAVNGKQGFAKPVAVADEFIQPEGA